MTGTWASFEPPISAGGHGRDRRDNNYILDVNIELLVYEIVNQK